MGKILQAQDQQAQKELRVTNAGRIYDLTKEKDIKFEDLEFGSRKFLQTAFDNTGPWGRMILDREVPGFAR